MEERLAIMTQLISVKLLNTGFSINIYKPCKNSRYLNRLPYFAMGTAQTKPMIIK